MVLPAPTNAGPVTRKKGKEPATASSSGSLSRSPSIATMSSVSASPASPKKNGIWSCARLAEKDAELEDQIDTLRLQFGSLQKDVIGMSDSLRTTAKNIAAVNVSGVSTTAIDQLNAKVDQVSQHFETRSGMLQEWVRRAEQVAVDAKTIATSNAAKLKKLQVLVDALNDTAGQADPSGKRPRLDFHAAPGLSTTFSTMTTIPSLPNPSAAATHHAPLPAVAAPAPAQIAQALVPVVTSSSSTSAQPIASSSHSPVLAALGRSSEPTGDVVLSGVMWRSDVFFEFHRCCAALGNRAIPRPLAAASIDRASMCGRFASPGEAAAFVNAWLLGPIGDPTIASVTAFHIPQTHSLFTAEPQVQAGGGSRRVSGGSTGSRTYRRNGHSGGGARRGGG